MMGEEGGLFSSETAWSFRERSLSGLRRAAILRQLKSTSICRSTMIRNNAARPFAGPEDLRSSAKEILRADSIPRRKKRNRKRNPLGVVACRLVHQSIVVADSPPHISLRMTRSAWTTPDQRVHWLKSARDLVMTVDSHVRDAGLVMRGRVVGLDAHQVRMPYMRTRVVDAGGVIVTVEGERSGLLGRDDRSAAHVDVLRSMMILIEQTGCFINQAQ